MSEKNYIVIDGQKIELSEETVKEMKRKLVVKRPPPCIKLAGGNYIETVFKNGFALSKNKYGRHMEYRTSGYNSTTGVVENNCYHFEDITFREAMEHAGIVYCEGVHEKNEFENICNYRVLTKEDYYWMDDSGTLKKNIFNFKHYYKIVED